MILEAQGFELYNEIIMPQLEIFPTKQDQKDNSLIQTALFK